MKSLWALVLLVLRSIRPIETRIYHTRDAITVAGEYENGENREAITHLLLPSATFSLSEKTCWTKSGEIGTCLGARACYPLLELEPLSADGFDGRHTTCSYESFGKQLYGLCCPLKPASKPHNSSNEGIKLQTQITSSAALPETADSTKNFTDFTTAKFAFPDSTTESYQPTTSNQESESIPAIHQPETVDYTCGMGPFKYLDADDQKRIVGGTRAVRNAWPFLVALLKNGRQFCGGSVLDSLRVLTAAHCIAQMSSWDVGRLEVALGMHELKPSHQSSTRLVKIKVRKVTRHRGFNSRTLYNDIAIVTLDTPIEYSSIVSPVCLPESHDDAFIGQDAVVIGWGTLKEGGSQPSVLQQVTVRIQSNEECQTRYGKDAPGGIVEHMLCASYPGKDACSGDSGGPLIVQSHPGAPWVQAGIVSWGIGCGKQPYPGVYTRVSYFLRWIEANIR